MARRRRAKWIQALKFFKGRKRIAFLRLYWTARINYPTREAAIFFMGAAWSLLRPFARELGQRLVDLGTLGAPDDIYYLTGEELPLAVDAATAGSASSKGRVQAMAELVDQVAPRRALREQRRRMVPPPAVPPQNTLQWADDATTFDTVKINPDSTDVMRGFAVSPGAVTGVASVVMSSDDFDRMKPDSILACPLTAPPARLARRHLDTAPPRRCTRAHQTDYRGSGSRTGFERIRGSAG